MVTATPLIRIRSRIIPLTPLSIKTFSVVAENITLRYLILFFVVPARVSQMRTSDRGTDGLGPGCNGEPSSAMSDRDGQTGIALEASGRH
jgi:hypothetical protein